MDKFILHGWDDVNAYMRDDYRLLVASMTVRQIPAVEAALQQLARAAFTSIPVQGARSFFKGHFVEQRKALARAMQNQPHITALVMALWAHAAQEQIQLLKHAGETAGLEFDAAFDWRQGMEGFFVFEDIPLLSALADGLGQHTTEQNYDHLKLAALWLGPAVINRDALAAPQTAPRSES
jgi:hypothetical protein